RRRVLANSSMAGLATLLSRLQPISLVALLTTLVLLFGFQADYAKATTEPSPPLSAFDRPLHHLIDARLMVAYAKALAAHGQLDKARFVADRLREFRRFADEPFLDVCAEPPEDEDEIPFQCLPYEGRPMDWRDFR
ncbi:MAG: hypothetical protein MK041_06770, partial [Aquabacterium sp.]|nr:hypothetical protein [Aquabacterium sp.]